MSYTSQIDEDPEVVDSPDPPRSHDSDDSEDEDDADETERKFEEIRSIFKAGEVNVRDAAALQACLLRYKSYLGKTAGDKKTILHWLITDANDKTFDEKYRALYSWLIKYDTGLMRKRDATEKTPIFAAISKKRREKLVELMCESDADITSVLGIPCLGSGNCLHAAIAQNVTPSLAYVLIGHSSESTLCAKDKNGLTPLHLAVEYARCNESQVSIVKKLLSKCDKALNERTSKFGLLSPYRYHEYTRREWKPEVTEQNRSASRVPSKSDNQEGAFKTPQGPQAVRGPSVQLMNTVRVPNPAISSGVATLGRPHVFGDVPLQKIQRRNTNLNELTSAATGAEKKKKAIVPPSDKCAKMISDHLKLYYLRENDHEDAVNFLYGQTQKREISFDLHEYHSSNLTRDRLEGGYAHLKLEDVLQYVHLPSMAGQQNSNATSVSPTRAYGQGRTVMVDVFRFLKDRGARKIIRLTVEESVERPHSDEAIENALRGLYVEVWDWKKYDLCTQSIVRSAPDVTKVHLYWSGNNAVLRGWSEPDGLHLLSALKKVILHFGWGLESRERTYDNIETFKRRLKNIELELSEERPSKEKDLMGLATDSAGDSPRRHKWLTSADQFANFIMNIRLTNLSPPLPQMEDILVALIDDGVDTNTEPLYGRIDGGRSFSRDTTQNLSRPWFITNGGHGTTMASFICRVCPLAKLFVIRLDEYTSEDATRQITAKSAASAIRTAIFRGVHIISMSWTIEKTAQNEADIVDLESAIEAAATAGILMFCAAHDQGVARDRSFPAACTRTKHIFKIGAARESGKILEWTGSPEDVDFLFPGHKIVNSHFGSGSANRSTTVTGSSVATAIAAGLAALILYCFQLAALRARSLNQRQGQGSNVVMMEDFAAVKKYEGMREAFLAIGMEISRGHKYVEVYEFFDNAVKQAKFWDDDKKMDVVSQVVLDLRKRKTFMK